MTTDTGRDPSGQALAVPVEPASGLAPTGFDPSRDADAYALDAWAFNVMLECSGLADDQPSEVAIGGALLDFRDLDRILEWARSIAFAGNIDALTGCADDQGLFASAIEARSDETRSGSAVGESAAPSGETPNA